MIAIAHVQHHFNVLNWKCVGKTSYKMKLKWESVGRGGPPALGLGVGLTTLHHKNKLVIQVLHTLQM
jgi:hypothetical protein